MVCEKKKSWTTEYPKTVNAGKFTISLPFSLSSFFFLCFYLLFPFLTALIMFSVWEAISYSWAFTRRSWRTLSGSVSTSLNGKWNAIILSSDLRTSTGGPLSRLWIYYTWLSKCSTFQIDLEPLVVRCYQQHPQRAEAWPWEKSSTAWLLCPCHGTGPSKIEENGILDSSGRY